MKSERERVVKIVREYQEQLRAVFGDQLEGVYLYGSFARDEAHNCSDVDVLVLLRPPFDYAEAMRKTSELTSRMSIEHDVVISRVFVSSEEMKSKNLPFYMNVRREGVVV